VLAWATRQTRSPGNHAAPPHPPASAGRGSPPDVGQPYAMYAACCGSVSSWPILPNGTGQQPLPGAIALPGGARCVGSAAVLTTPVTRR
jgi:hypothetical protein